MRIVLVEDSPGDRRWFNLAVSEISTEIDITAFESATGALEHFESSTPPELIVSDWHLSILSFPEFLQQVRSIKAYDSVPMAVLTGLAKPVCDKAIELGAVCCLEKPVQPDQLQAFYSLQFGGQTTQH